MLFQRFVKTVVVNGKLSVIIISAKDGDYVKVGLCLLVCLSVFMSLCLWYFVDFNECFQETLTV